jgi:hypothetical protein
MRPADALLAGTYGDGLFRSVDGGRSWAHVEAGLTASTFRFVSAELAGTEPARVFRSADGGRSWEELEGITRIAGYERWYLPYSPRAGAARNAYVCGDRLLVAAEVAGLLRSEDGGAHLGMRAGRRRRGRPPRHGAPGRSRPSLRLARHCLPEPAGRPSRGHRPLARRRSELGEA